MENDIIMLENNASKSEIQRNGLISHSSKHQRAHQPYENLKTSSPLYQRPVHIPVQMVYPAIQKTSEDNRNKISGLSDSDTKEDSAPYSSDMDDDSREECEANEVGDGATGRRPRDFVPDGTKDARYWVKRIKNNLSAKRSREKRRMADNVMESKVSKLAQENEDLRSELANIKRLVQDNIIKDTKQGVAVDMLPPPQGPQTQFVVGVSPQSLPLIIPTYHNPLSRFPTPQEIMLLPQSGLPQSGIAQPGFPQSGLPQPGLPHHTIHHHGVPQPLLPKHGLQQYNLQQAVRSVSHAATLSSGSFPPFIASSRNVNSFNRPELEDRSRWPTAYIPKPAGSESTSHSKTLQESAIQSTDISTVVGNGVTKARSPGDKLCPVYDAGIPSAKASERTRPLVESPIAESKPVSAIEDVCKPVSTSPTSSEISDTSSLAEINKLPHKLRARFLRSLCHQEEVGPTDSEVNTPAKQLTMKDDPILMNIKREKDDEVPHEVDNMEIECTSSVPLRTQWIPPKVEFPQNPLHSIEEELEQARNLVPTPNRTMNRSEAQAYVELAKAASELVGARLQTKDFSAPSMRQLTRQRTRDMNFNEKYRDKRVRNNIAAKKCRDAKRLLNDYRSSRSNFFEVENVTLRNEVEGLTKDVMRLRELVRRKQLPLYKVA
eukprot:XP_003724320.1 PREDICTED: uncharacterized protein LOC100890317 [Strongylocentrotus purpuratus]